jgi:hypothetical protein
MITGVRGLGSGDEHHPKVFPQVGLMLAHDFAHATSNTIADSRATHASRRYKSGAACAATSHRENANHDQLPTFYVAGLLHPLEF